MPTGTQVDEAIRGSAALRAGHLTPTVLRGPRWRRLFRDVYLPAGVPVDHAVRCRGAALLLPAGAALAGHSAASVWRVLDVPPEAPVQVVVPPGVRFGPVKGLVVRTAPLPRTDVARAGGLRLTTPERTAWDLATRPDPVEAVAALDAFARAGLVDLRALAGRAVDAAGRKGSRRARIALGLADPRAGSPAESRLRVRLVLAGVPAAVPRFGVRLDDGYLARLTLAWPQRRVGLAYEADHGGLNRLLGAGWLVLYATGERVRDDWPALVDEVQRALARRNG